MLKWLNPVQAATTGPLIEALQLVDGDWKQVVIDGIKISPGDRVLVKDEPSQIPFQEGIYQVEPDGSWDFVDEAEPEEAKLLVTSGDTNRDTVFFLDVKGAWVAVLSAPPRVDTGRFSNPLTYKPGIGEGWDDDPLAMNRR